MRIQHNIMAMNAYRNYTSNVSAMKKNLEKLSSGYKINRAGDDAAGLAISEKMRAQITGLQQAQNNAKSGINLVQTAEGALTEVHDMLNRMVKLADQSANGTYDNDTDRNQLQKEVNQLLDEINRIADSSNFNGINLLDGTLGLNSNAFEIDAVNAEEAGEVSGFATMTAPSTAANAVTKLHTQSATAVKGEFTVYLGQANVGAPASGTASIKVTIGGKELTVKADAAKTALTASKIATNLISETKGGGAYFYVKADGTYGFAAKESAAITAAGAKGLIYQGAVDSTNNVKYTLTKYVSAGGTGVAVTTGTSSNMTADNVSSKAFIDLNMDVKIAAGSKGACTYNAANVGTNAKNSVMKADGQLGSAEFTVDLSKIKEGVEIEIGGVKKTITLNKSDTDAAKINLSAFVKADGTLDTTKQGKIMDKIATAFKGAVTGIDVGVNAGGKLTLSEQKGAASTVYKKMESKSSFESLVKLNQGEVKAGSNIKVKDAGSINEGDVLNVGDKKIIFTKKASNTGGEYINISGKDANTIASEIATKVSGTATGDTVKVNGVMALGRGLTLQIGDTSDDFNQLNVKVQDMHTNSLGIDKLDISTEVSAQKAIQKIKDAINTVSDVRGTLGATQNRLDHTINNLSVMTENIQDAESTIRDTDVADEMMAYTKNNILIQSAQAMLAQANQVPQGVLQLLQ